MESEQEATGRASDPETRADLLHRLAGHRSDVVRSAVACNPGADDRTLRSLVGDPSSRVRRQLQGARTLFDSDSYEFSNCKNTKLALANENDAAFIVSLRSNPDLNRHVSRVEADLDTQVAWLRAYKTRESMLQEFYYVIKDSENRRLGTVRLYDFQSDSFCWGSWIVSPDAPAKAAIESALNVYEFAFYTLGFKRSHFDVRKENSKVIAFHKRMGADTIRSNELDVFFSFTREKYDMARRKYSSLFRPGSGGTGIE